MGALRSLGNVQQQLGELDKSQKSLQHSLEIAQRLQVPEEISLTKFSLGNTTRLNGDINNAITHYQNAANSAPYTYLLTYLFDFTSFQIKWQFKIKL